MNKLLLIGLTGLFLTACGGNAAVNSNVSQANAANTANAVNVVNANAAQPTANVNKTENTNAAKPADNGPKRVSFGKGQTTSAENMVLAPGESKKFVIGAKKGQVLSIDSSAHEAKITLLTKGKDSDSNTEDGHFDTTLTGDGDFIFEVSNPTKKEFKTSVNIAIDFIAD